jgi:pilus assembly protein CpaC
VIVVTPYLVNPVNANDIKLPTDGYNTPNELQRILGNMENDGKSGAERPKPSAGAQSATNPTVGALSDPAAASSPRQAREERGSRRNARTAKATPAPGFNLD